MNVCPEYHWTIQNISNSIIIKIQLILIMFPSQLPQVSEKDSEV